MFVQLPFYPNKHNVLGDNHFSTLETYLSILSYTGTLHGLVFGEILLGLKQRLKKDQLTVHSWHTLLIENKHMDPVHKIHLQSKRTMQFLVFTLETSVHSLSWTPWIYIRLKISGVLSRAVTVWAINITISPVHNLVSKLITAKYSIYNSTVAKIFQLPKT